MELTGRAEQGEKGVKTGAQLTGRVCNEWMKLMPPTGCGSPFCRRWRCALERPPIKICTCGMDLPEKSATELNRLNRN